MSDCSKHKKEIAGIFDMNLLAVNIGDLHYESLRDLLYYLYKKLEADGEKDYEDGKEKTASDLQYLSMSIFESYLRADKLWKTCKPFMKEK